MMIPKFHDNDRQNRNKWAKMLTRIECHGSRRINPRCKWARRNRKLLADADSARAAR